MTEVVRHHSKKLVGVLKAELQIEEGELLDEIHARTLERIFIEERIYKAIENKKTPEGIVKAVMDGLSGFRKEIGREVLLEDVERLLKIPIRRISLYDIERAKAEMDRLLARLKEVKRHLGHLTDYAVSWLEAVAKRLEASGARKTKLASFTAVDVREVAKRDLALRYDGQSGYLGTAVSTGETQGLYSSFEKVLLIRRSGIWSVVPLPEKLFVDQGLLYSGLAEKDALAGVVFTLVYRDGGTGFPFIKRFRIEGWIMNKDYPLLPEDAQVLWFSAAPASPFTVKYKPKPRLKVKDEAFRIQDFEPKGIKANGVRLAARECLSALGPEPKKDPELFSGAEEASPRKSRAQGAEAPVSKVPKKAKPEAKAKPKATKAGSLRAKQPSSPKSGLLAAAQKLADTKGRKKTPAKSSPASKPKPKKK